MDSKSVLRIEPKNSGFLLIKGGGSAEFVYACSSLNDVHKLIDETYNELHETEGRLLPPHIQAQLEHAQAADEAVS